MTDKQKRISGRDACVAAIRAAGKPLTANEIATMVVESGAVPTLKGLTPKATLSAQITSGAKKGLTFKKVGSGKPQRFDLVDGVPESPEGLVETLRGQLTPMPPDPVEDVTETAKEQSEAEATPKEQAKPHPKPTATRKQTGRKKAGATA